MLHWFDPLIYIKHNTIEISIGSAKKITDSKAQRNAFICADLLVLQVRTCFVCAFRLSVIGLGSGSPSCSWKRPTLTRRKYALCCG